MSKRTRLLGRLKHVYSHNAKLVLDVSNDDIGLIIEGVEKQIAKKLHIYANGEEHCPTCDENLTGLGFKRCIECGQLLTWEGGVEHE